MGRNLKQNAKEQGPKVPALRVKKPTGLAKSTLTGSEQEKALQIRDLEERRRQMKDQLQQVEIQIFNLESQYLEKANPRGNALKGYEGLLSSISANSKKAGLKQEDRIFSGSSLTGSQ